MSRINIAGQLFFGIIFITGVIFFLWFCWPALFKGIINTGNICGMAGSAALLIYAVRHKTIHYLLINLWHGKIGRICLLLALLSAIAVLLLMGAAAAAILQADSEKIPDHTPAVVLGCSVKGEKPSRILQERIDAAYAYMQKYPQAICILSGGKGEDEDISEAECMYRELVQAGIDAERLYREADSVNTQENLEKSKKILDQLGISGALTVISSDFHLYRGRQWAQLLGYENYGYAAHTDWKYRPTFFLREMIAVTVIWAEKSMQKISHYLTH